MEKDFVKRGMTKKEMGELIRKVSRALSDIYVFFAPSDKNRF